MNPRDERQLRIADAAKLDYAPELNALMANKGFLLLAIKSGRLDGPSAQLLMLEAISYLQNDSDNTNAVRHAAIEFAFDAREMMREMAIERAEKRIEATMP